jgi:hypothetical protein
MGKKQATTSPVKNSKSRRWLRRFIILVGILAGLWLVNFLTWLPAYMEVWSMARDPMAEKGVLGLKLKSSYERHRVPTERGFLKKSTYPSVDRYYEMPQNESANDLLSKLRRYAESSGWKLDKERSGVEYFIGYKDIEGRKYQVSVGIGDEKVVYVSVEGLGN